MLMFVYMGEGERDRDPGNHSDLDTYDYCFKDLVNSLIQEDIWLPAGFLNISFAPHHLMGDTML